MFIIVIFSIHSAFCCAHKLQAKNSMSNPLTFTAWQFWWNLISQSKIVKRIEGEMFIRVLPSTLLQIFCKIILYYEVIVKSIIDPDDNFFWKGLVNGWVGYWRVRLQPVGIPFVQRMAVVRDINVFQNATKKSTFGHQDTILPESYRTKQVSSMMQSYPLELKLKRQLRYYHINHFIHVAAKKFGTILTETFQVKHIKIDFLS